MDMDEALDQWLKQVSKAAQLSIKDQEKITKAGADVLADKLQETTKEKHPDTKGSGGKYGHLSEDISSATGDIDKEHNGNSVAGFGDKAFVARFLNDGTKKFTVTILLIMLVMMPRMQYLQLKLRNIKQLSPS